jgi:hypothetical protein
MVRRTATVLPIKQPAALPDTVPACHYLIERLLQRLNVLEERPRLNSGNFSKPPSSAGPWTPPRTPKVQSDKRLGGQPGHKGSFRAFLPEDQLASKVLCPPLPQCTACGCAVEADGDKPRRHQVFELPKIEPIVTEYVRLRGVCSGCHGALPTGVLNGQLGPRALALVGTLAGQFHQTPRKVQDVLAHIMDIRFSLGAVSQAHGLVSQALAAPVAQLHAELQHPPVCHVNGTRHQQSHELTMLMWVLASAPYTMNYQAGRGDLDFSSMAEVLAYES